MSEGLIPVRTVRYDVPALLSKAARRTVDVRSAAIAIDFVNCYAPNAFLRFKVHQNLFSAETPSQTMLGEITTLPRPCSQQEGRIPLFTASHPHRRHERLNEGQSGDLH